MIHTLAIRNYKSIKSLDLESKRINVFLGEHNSGKSNIMEALNWLSQNMLFQNTFEVVFRFKNATDFFYDFDTSKPIWIQTDKIGMGLRLGINQQGALLNQLQGVIFPQNELKNKDGIDWRYFESSQRSQTIVKFSLEFDGIVSRIEGNVISPVRTYIFKKLRDFQPGMRPYLEPPFGSNIPSLLISNPAYKELVGSLFREKGFRLMLNPAKNEITMAKDVNDELYAYPYNSISETLQRIIFYTLAIETNKNAVLVLDEPESNTFPMYTKQLGELMALNESNQYFIATHNPYLLQSLISKTPLTDIAVFVTKMEDFETKIYPVKSETLSDIMDKGIDVYFNLDKLMEA